MAVSSSAGTKSTVGALVLRAYRRAGIMSIETPASGKAWDVKFAHGKALLDDILKSLQAYNVQARALVFREYAVIENVATVTLDSDVLNVVGTGVLIQDDSANSEITVAFMSQERWQKLPKTSVYGKPSNAYFERSSDTQTVSLWPTPDSAMTLRLRVLRDYADADGELVDVDLLPYWNKYLISQLAADLAADSSMPEPKVQRLLAVAERELRQARCRAAEIPPTQIAVGHRSRRS